MVTVQQAPTLVKVRTTFRAAAGLINRARWVWAALPDGLLIRAQKKQAKNLLRWARASGFKRVVGLEDGTDFIIQKFE
jgi:hypothetical protein